MSGPFLQIWNKHTPACGEPPTTSNESGGQYLGYFENKHGEQWVFIYDCEKKTAELRGGDIDWAKPVAVEGGGARITLNEEEAAWLQARWKAATGGG